MKVKAKSFEAWKVIMITLVFLSYCVGMMPGEKAQAVYLPTLLFLILGLYYSPG